MNERDGEMTLRQRALAAYTGARDERRASNLTTMQSMLSSILFVRTEPKLLPVEVDGMLFGIRRRHADGAWELRLLGVDRAPGRAVDVPINSLEDLGEALAQL